MNQEIYPQIYRTTEAMGTDQTPTPIKISVSKNGEDFYINAEGADGQQVSDAISSAIRQMPGAKKQSANGFLEFAIGLLFISFVTVAIVNIFFLMNPHRPTQNQTQISLVEDERGADRR